MIKLEHVGACMIKFAGVSYLPGDVIEVDEINDGFKRLIRDKKLVIQDDSKATKEVIQEIEAKVRKKKVSKSISELENGGEYK